MPALFQTTSIAKIVPARWQTFARTTTLAAANPSQTSQGLLRVVLLQPEYTMRIVFKVI